MAQQLGTVLFAARQHPWDVAGRTVVVIGQGSAGLFWTWSLKRAGAARVIVADRSPTRLAASAGFGSDVRVDARTDDLTEAVMDLTGGEGADFVVEAVGRRETLLQSIGLCRTGRAAVLVRAARHERPGADRLPAVLPPQADGLLHLRRAGRAGPGVVPPGARAHRAGDVDVRPLLSHVLPVEEIAEAFRLAGACEDGVLKVSIAF